LSVKLVNKLVALLKQLAVDQISDVLLLDKRTLFERLDALVFDVDLLQILALNLV
jgi:hypothetical protein